MFLVYNSDILFENDFHVSVQDRAFQYGDGLFETVRYEQGKVCFWSDHFARLSAGLLLLQLVPAQELTADSLHQQLVQLLSANNLTNQPARIKIQIWRQPGGLYTPTQSTANVLITARPGKVFTMSSVQTVRLYDAFRVQASPVSALKTLNALPYILAGLFKQQQQADDVLILDPAGHLAECLASNLFWLSGQTLYTPSLQTGCINGILRRQIIRLAISKGIPLEEGFYLPSQLGQAQVVFCTNVMGMQWFHSIQDGHTTYTYTPTPAALALLHTLFTELGGR